MTVGEMRIRIGKSAEQGIHFKRDYGSLKVLKRTSCVSLWVIKTPSHEQSWANTTRRVQILFPRSLVAERCLSLEIVFLDILCKTHVNSVSVQPVARRPHAFENSGINTCSHASMSYNCQLYILM